MQSFVRAADSAPAFEEILLVQTVHCVCPYLISFGIMAVQCLSWPDILHAAAQGDWRMQDLYIVHEQACRI